MDVDIETQEDGFDRRELEQARLERHSSQRKCIFNWKLLKENLIADDIIDSFVTEELVDTDFRNWIKKVPRRYKIESILRNALKKIQTTDDYVKFESLVVREYPFLQLQTPSDDLHLPGDRRAEHHLRANIELIEKEMYPKDYIDSFLEWFILSLEDHEELRNKETVRKLMARSFLEKIQQQSFKERGSIKRLICSFQQDTNHILMRVSKLMDSDLPNGISKFIDDTCLQELMNMRDGCRNSIISKWTYLIENLEPLYVIDDLKGSELIDQDTADIISDNPRKVGAYALLRYLVRRIDRPAKFLQLISDLMKTNQHVAEKLQINTSPNAFVAETKYDVEKVTRRLQLFEEDLKEEFDTEYLDKFLERQVFDVDDHELIWESANYDKGRAKCFYDTISTVKYIEKGSIQSLLYCLTNSKDNKKIQQILAKLLLSEQMPDKVKNRTEVQITTTSEVIYSRNTSSFTEGELKLSVEDKEIKLKVENEIFEIVGSSEYIDEEIVGLKLTIKDTSRSSVIVHLKSDSGNVKFIVENGIVNGDLKLFLRNLLNDENIKMHLSPGQKYKVLVSIKAHNDQRDSVSEDNINPKLRIIKANRELLEEEYDPLPLLKAVFEENVKGYGSVKKLSSEYITVFKEQFSEIYKVQERRKRVTQFLDTAETQIEADTLWDFVKDTTNTFSIQKMENDLSRLIAADLLPKENVEKGLVFEGEYDVWLAEKDVKSPLQSMILEERQKKDEEKRRLEEKRRREAEEQKRKAEEEKKKKEEDNRRKQEEEEKRKTEEKEQRRRKEKELNAEVEFWKIVRNHTLPNLDKLTQELGTANEKIRNARTARNATVMATLVGGALFSIFTGGASMAAALGAAAVTGAAGITLLIETYVEKDVLNRTQEGINQDKDATLRLITRVRAYSGSDSIPFAEQLYSVRLESIDDLTRTPLKMFISSLVDTESASLVTAIERITTFRRKLEKELQEVERVQRLHTFQ